MGTAERIVVTVSYAFEFELYVFVYFFGIEESAGLLTVIRVCNVVLNHIAGITVEGKRLFAFGTDTDKAYVGGCGVTLIFESLGNKIVAFYQASYKLGIIAAVVHNVTFHTIADFACVEFGIFGVVAYKSVHLCGKHVVAFEGENTNT